MAVDAPDAGDRDESPAGGEQPARVLEGAAHLLPARRPVPAPQASQMALMVQVFALCLAPFAVARLRRLRAASWRLGEGQLPPA